MILRVGFGLRQYCKLRTVGIFGVDPVGQCGFLSAQHCEQRAYHLVDVAAVQLVDNERTVIVPQKDARGEFDFPVPERLIAAYDVLRTPVRRDPSLLLRVRSPEN